MVLSKHLASTVQTFSLHPWTRVSCVIHRVGPHVCGGRFARGTRLVPLFLVARPTGLAGFGGCHPWFRFPSACHYPKDLAGRWLLGPVGDLRVFAIPSMLLHMGGYEGVEEVLAFYEAGLGQGEPVSALLFCLLGEPRAALALVSTGLLATPARPLRWLGCVDDTSWLVAKHMDGKAGFSATRFRGYSLIT